MTYIPKSNLENIKKSILLHPELPSKTSALMHCHSEAEFKLIWDKLLKEKLDDNSIKTIVSLAEGIDLPVPEKSSWIKKLSKLN